MLDCLGHGFKKYAESQALDDSRKNPESRWKCERINLGRRKTRFERIWNREFDSLRVFWREDFLCSYLPSVSCDFALLTTYTACNM